MNFTSSVFNESSTVTSTISNSDLTLSMNETSYYDSNFII